MYSRRNWWATSLIVQQNASSREMVCWPWMTANFTQQNKYPILGSLTTSLLRPNNAYNACCSKHYELNSGHILALSHNPILNS